MHKRHLNRKSRLNENTLGKIKSLIDKIEKENKSISRCYEIIMEQGRDTLELDTEYEEDYDNMYEVLRQTYYALKEADKKLDYVVTFMI